MALVRETDSSHKHQILPSPNGTDIEIDAQPLSLPNINNLPKVSGSEYSGNQQPPQGEELIDVTVVYAKNDYDKAIRFIEWLKSLFNEHEISDVRIKLFDDEFFCPDKVKNVETVVAKTMYAFMLLTKEFEMDIDSEFFNSEALGQTRLAEGEDLRRFAGSFLKKDKYAVRPVHTQKSAGRNYRIPSGLHSLRSIDYYDKDSSHTRTKTKQILTDAIRKRKKQEADLHRHNYEYEAGDSKGNMYQGASASDEPLSKHNIFNSNLGSLQLNLDSMEALSIQYNFNQKGNNEENLPNRAHANSGLEGNREQNRALGNSSQTDNNNFSISDSDYGSANTVSGNNPESPAGRILSSNASDRSISDVVDTRYPELRSMNSTNSVNNFSSAASMNPVCKPEEDISFIESSEGFSYNRTASGSKTSSSSNTTLTDSSSENDMKELQQDGKTSLESREDRHSNNQPPLNDLRKDGDTTGGDVGGEVRENTVCFQGEGHSKNAGVMAGAGYDDYAFSRPPHAQQANQMMRPVHTPMPPDNPRFPQGQMPRQAVQTHGQGAHLPYSYGDLPSDGSWQEDGGSSLPVGQNHQQYPPPRYYEGGDRQPYQPHPPRYYEGVERVTHIHYHFNDPAEGRQHTRENTPPPPPPPPPGPQYNILGCNIVQIGSDNAVQQSDSAGQINDQVNVIPSTVTERRGEATSANNRSNEDDDDDEYDELDDDDDDNDDDDDDDDETSRHVGDSWNNLSQDQYPSNSLPDQNILTESVREQTGTGEEEEEEESDENNDDRETEEQTVRGQQATGGQMSRGQRQTEGQTREGQQGTGGQTQEGQQGTGGQTQKGQQGTGGQTQGGQQGTGGQTQEGQQGTGGQTQKGQQGTGRQGGQQTGEEEESAEDNETNDEMSEFLDKHLNDSGTLDLESTVDTNLQLGAHSGTLVASSKESDETFCKTPVSMTESKERSRTCEQTTATSHSEAMSSNRASTDVNLTTINNVTPNPPPEQTTPTNDLAQAVDKETSPGAIAQVLSDENSRNKDENTGNLTQARLQPIGALFEVQRQYVPGGRVKREIRTCPPCQNKITESIIHHDDDDDLD